MLSGCKNKICPHTTKQISTRYSYHMRTFLPPICMLLFLFMRGPGKVSAQSDYTIRFQHLGKKKGVLLIGWYRDAAGFRQPSKAVFSRQVPVSGVDSVSVVFPQVPAGKYAVAVFFDLDGDGVLDTNVLGIPKERYGFSNNVYPTFRAASFSEAAFDVGTGPAHQTIRLK